MIKTWTGLIVEDLKASYQQHHPDRLKFFYRLVMDIGDYKTQELTLDEVWEFEKKMHMPEEKGDLAIKKFCKKMGKMRVFKTMLYSSSLKHSFLYSIVQNIHNPWKLSNAV